MALLRAWEAFELAGKEGRWASFHWENGRFIKPLWIGRPLHRARPICGARCRDGHACRARVAVRQDGALATRCKNHGGLSTGARTAEGRARIAESNRRRAQAGAEAAST